MPYKAHFEIKERKVKVLRFSSREKEPKVLKFSAQEKSPIKFKIRSNFDLDVESN